MKKLLRFFTKKENDVKAAPKPAPGAEATVKLQGRSVSRMVVPIAGASILELADRSKVDWMSNCKRGTCARCRCLVSEGMEHLSTPNQAELNRLTPEEIEQGYRLGCQARVTSSGTMSIKHAPYF